METDFAFSKGNNQSCDVKNKVFKKFGFHLNFHIIEGERMRSKIVISEGLFQMCQLFGVNELKSLYPNIVKYNRLCFPTFICILKTKDPHVSDVNEVSPTFRIFWVILEGKVNLANRGRLFIFARIHNQVLKKGTLFKFLINFFFDT